MIGLNVLVILSRSTHKIHLNVISYPTRSKFSEVKLKSSWFNFRTIYSV